MTIVGDDIYELNENFTVTFTVVNPNDEIEGEVMVTVTILEGMSHIRSYTPWLCIWLQVHVNYHRRVA